MSESLYNFSIVSNMEFFLAGVAGQFRNLEQDDLRKVGTDLKTYNTILSLQTRIREVYDSYIPNIHVLDINTVTKLVIDNIKSKLNFFIVFNKTDSTGQDLSLDTKNAALDKLYDELSKENSETYNKLKTSIRSAVSKHWQSLKVAGNPIEELNTISAKLLSIQTNSNITNEEAINIGKNFAAKIEKVFGRKAVLGVYDTDLGSSNDVYIYFGKSFEGMRSSINEPISQAVKEQFLQILSKDIISNVNVGYVVNFGHAMAVSKDGANEIGRFINSPGFASSIYGVAKSGVQGPQLEQAAAYYRDKSGLITNKIEFTKNFQTKANILMQLGVTFTLPEDWNINQSRGREEEGPTKLSLVGKSAKKFSRQDQIDYIKYIIGILRQNVLTKSPENASSSKTLKEFIRASVLSILKGEEVKDEKSKIVREKRTIVKQRIVVLNNAAKKQLKLNKPAVSKPKASRSATRKIVNVPTSTINLTYLMLQINSAITEQVKRNMGTGDRSDILNLRSGRFAESVKVERMSQSREGMITAFYSYMKNPYATFSTGGLQGSPKTRDPKLLIAKSIRELATQQVQNRLRSVVV